MGTKVLVGFLLCVTRIHGSSSPPSHGDTSYPVYTRCDTEIVKKIETYWSTNGRPHDIIQTMSKNTRHVDYHTSYDLDSNYECIFLDVFIEGVDDSSFNFTLTLNNGSAPERYDYNVVERENGILHGKPYGADDAPEFRWVWYTIYVDDALHVDYVCNREKGVPTVPLGDIFVAANSFQNQSVIAQSDKYKQLLTSWGFDLKFTSSNKCFVPY